MRGWLLLKANFLLPYVTYPAWKHQIPTTRQMERTSSYRHHQTEGLCCKFLKLGKQAVHFSSLGCALGKLDKDTANKARISKLLDWYWSFTQQRRDAAIDFPLLPSSHQYTQHRYFGGRVLPASDSGSTSLFASLSIYRVRHNKVLWYHFLAL